MKRFVGAVLALSWGALGSSGAPAFPAPERAREAQDKTPREASELFWFYPDHLAGSEEFIKELVTGRQGRLDAAGFTFGVCLVAALATAYLLMRCFAVLTTPKTPSTPRFLSTTDGDGGSENCTDAHQLRQRLQEQQEQQQQQQQQKQQQQQQQQHLQQQLMDQVRMQIGLLSLPSEEFASLTPEEQRSVQEALDRATVLLQRAKKKVAAATGFKKSLEEDNAELQRQLSEVPPGAPPPPSVLQLVEDIKSDTVVLRKYREEAKAAVDDLYGVGCTEKQFGWTLLYLAERQVQQQQQQQQTQQPVLPGAVAALVAANVVLGFPPPPLDVTNSQVQAEIDDMAEKVYRELCAWIRVLKQPNFLEGAPHLVQKQLDAAAATTQRARSMAIGLEELQMKDYARRLREMSGKVEIHHRNADRRRKERQQRQQQEKQRRQRHMQQQLHILGVQDDLQRATARLTAVVAKATAAKQREELESVYLELATAMKEAEGLDEEVLRGTTTGHLLAEAAAAALPRMKELRDDLKDAWEETLQNISHKLAMALSKLAIAHKELEQEAKKSTELGTLRREPPPPAFTPGGSVKVLSSKEERALKLLEKLLTVYKDVKSQHEHLQQVILAYKPDPSLQEMLRELGNNLDAAKAAAEVTVELMLRTLLMPLDAAAEAESSAKESLKKLEKQQREMKAAGQKLTREAEEEKALRQQILEDASKVKLSAVKKVVAAQDAFKSLSLPGPVQEMIELALLNARAPLFPGAVSVPELKPAASDVDMSVTLPRLKFLGLPVSQPGVELPGIPEQHPAGAAAAAAAVASGARPRDKGASGREFTGLERGRDDGASLTGSISSLLSLYGNPPIEEGSSLLEFSFEGETQEKVKDAAGAAAPAAAAGASAPGAAAAHAATAHGSRASGEEGQKQKDTAHLKGQMRKSLTLRGAATAGRDQELDKAGETQPKKSQKSFRRPRWRSHDGLEEWAKRMEKNGGIDPLTRHSSLSGLHAQEALGGTLKKSKSMDPALAHSHASGTPKQRRRSIFKKARSLLSLRRLTSSLSSLRAQETAAIATTVAVAAAVTAATAAEAEERAKREGGAAATAPAAAGESIERAMAGATGSLSRKAETTRQTEEEALLSEVPEGAKTGSKKGKDAKRMSKRTKSPSGGKSLR